MPSPIKTVPGSAICGDANHGQDDVRLGLLRRCQSTIKMIPARPIVASQYTVKTVLGLVYCGDGFPTDEVTIGSAYCGDVITFCNLARPVPTLPILSFLLRSDHLNNVGKIASQTYNAISV